MLNNDSQENSNIISFERSSKNLRLSKLKQQSVLFQEKGSFAEAADALKSAVKLDQNNEELHLDLGLTLAKLNKFDEAIPHFRAACDLNGDNIEPYYYLGLACSQTGLHKKALDCWKHCLNAKDPSIDEYELRLRLSETYADLKRYGKALFQLVEHVIPYDPFNLDAYNSLAMLLLHIGKLPPTELDEDLSRLTSAQYFDLAKNCLLNNLKRNPKYYYTHLCLGTMYLEQGFLEMAIRELKCACKNSPPDVDAAPFFTLGYALNLRGDLEEACEALKKGLRYDPYDDDCLYLLGNIEMSLDRLDNAESSFKQILEHSPNNYQAICALGILELNRDHIDEAKRYYDKALEINPEDPTANYCLGMLLCRNYDDIDKAETYLKKAIAADSGNALYHFSYGQVLAAQGKFHEAKKVWEKAVQLDENTKESVQNELEALKKIEDDWFTL